MPNPSSLTSPSEQRPAPATFEELIKFHSEDYVRFLKTITPDNMAEHTKQMQRFNVGEDSPVFDGLYQFCQVRPHRLAAACLSPRRSVGGWASADGHLAAVPQTPTFSRL